MRSHSSASAPTTGPRSIRPASLTRVSNRPNRSTACWTAASAWVRSVMSASTASAVPPALSIWAARASSRSRRRATSATQAPCSASWRAVAAPIPLLAPVTRAAVPVSFDSMGCRPLLLMYGIAGGPQGRYRVAVRERGFCPCLRWGRFASWVPGCGGLGAVVGEVAGQLPVGVDLGEEVVGLLLNRCDRVGSCDPARRRVLLPGEFYEGGGELGGVAGLLAVHGLPGRDGLRGALGV